MGEYFIHTDQMVVGYDGKPLIKDVEIKMKRGEILTLIGPNGAGKSTILKSMTRQLKLVAGTVYMNQEMMSKMSGKEVAKKLAVVMTERIQPELMTCEDIVATGRYPYTGTLGILSAEDWKRFTGRWRWSMQWILRTEISRRSAMARDREYFWPGQSVRNRK